MLLLRLTAISSSAKDCHLVFQSDPVFCSVPDSHSVDASTLPPTPTHREASMQSLAKPFKCPASGTKIGRNEISSQISRVHLKIILCGWTGVLTSRLWEMKLLLLGTSLTLIQEAHHSYLTFDSETVGGECVWRVFRGTVTFCEALWPGCNQIPARSNRWSHFWWERAEGRISYGGLAPTPSWSNWVACRSPFLLIPVLC